ncbi:cyclin-dependent kinase inhibitor 1C [Bufo gargarizans]|uniref:cyclin-dependent kinase inhibitor 1C n=1 Tax=Bufo gargarizans TaxID=30331 RepID=UPI001CF20022|nr:cyclin-dependent kinase inhibitor 1C [Bufo gargarizans]
MCNVQRPEGAPRPGTKACRSLFGPVDHVELSRELHARLREMREESSRRWDFDFQRGVPLASSRYAWEETGEETVPRFYRTPRASATPERSPGALTSSPPATPDRTPGALTSDSPATPGPTPAALTSCPPATPDCAPPAPTARPGDKRPPAQITDYFPARKKNKVVAALCDKLHAVSPLPTEHTPRKMIR